jgi:hypothetical protein
MLPTTPAQHCAITSLGLLMMNSGAPMIGSGSRASAPGSLDIRTTPAPSR